METIDSIDFRIDTADLNKNLQNFCASILVYYQDILNDSELSVCKCLINGQTMLGTSKTLGLSRERVRQIFNKSILRIKSAHHKTLDEMAKLKNEIEELKHRNLILEKELLSEQSVDYVDSLMKQEKTLCKNAQRLLNSPIAILPLPLRSKTVLNSAKVSKFSEIPLLSEAMLIKIKRCGKKTIHDIQAYLHSFSLELGLTFDEVIIRMAQLNDENISPENFSDSKRITIEDFLVSPLTKGVAPITEEVTQSYENQMQNTHKITLDDICTKIGPSTKKGRRKWSRAVKQILNKNRIDTLEKLLSLKPSEFLEFEGVGRTTLYYTRKAVESFGFVWSDAT